MQELITINEKVAWKNMMLSILSFH